MSHTLGQQLRRARLKRGLSLPDVAHLTRIPANRLAALEEDNYNSHGGLIYAKSFLRTYARLLEVDASPILDRLQPPPIAGATDYRYLLNNLGPWISHRTKRYSPSVRTAAESPTSARNTLVSVGMICGCVALLACSLMFAGEMFNTSPHPSEDPALIPIATIPLQASPPQKENPHVTVLPATPTETTQSISWSSHPETLSLPLQHVTPAGIPKALPVSSEPTYPAPVKAVPVID